MQGDTNMLWIYGVMIIVIVGLFIFSGRRNKKYEQEQAMMRNSLQVGDEITTIGGIIGKITSIKGETVTIETSKDKTKIRFLKTAIRSVDVKAEESAALRAMPKKTDNTQEKTEALPDANAPKLADETDKITPAKKKSKAKANVVVASAVAEVLSSVAEPADEETLTAASITSAEDAGKSE